jgi:hypothetical protein
MRAFLDMHVTFMRLCAIPKYIDGSRACVRNALLHAETTLALATP